MKSALFLLLLFFSLLTVPVRSDNPLERNRSLRRELAELQTRKNALLEESARLKETKETLETTRDLLSGKLEKPPAARPLPGAARNHEAPTNGTKEEPITAPPFAENAVHSVARLRGKLSVSTTRRPEGAG